MNRDLDYIRELLFEMEAREEVALVIVVSHQSNPNDKQLYHAKLLCDAGYFTNELSHKPNRYRFRMTNQGHDYLDTIRDDTNWSNIVTKIKPLSSVPLEIIKALGIKYLSTELGL